jgi:hypothetical protein
VEQPTRRVRAVGNPRVERPLVDPTVDAELLRAATGSGRDSIALGLTDVTVDLAVDARVHGFGGRIPRERVTIVRRRALHTNADATPRPSGAGPRGATRPCGVVPRRHSGRAPQARFAGARRCGCDERA